MTQEMITGFFGWMAILNMGILALMSLAIVIFQDRIAALHGRMFGIETSEIRQAYFRYLANYKTLTFILCVIPWIALKLI